MYSGVTQTAASIHTEDGLYFVNQLYIIPFFPTENVHCSMHFAGFRG